MELEGKIINFLGDSITEGHSVADIENNRFDHILKRRCNLKKANNYGIGGTRIAHQSRPSKKARWDLNFCGRAFDMDKDADIIVVFGGVNDYNHGDAPFGTLEDSTRETFCGCANYLTDLIQELYPDAVHVFLTPAHRKGDARPSPSRPEDAPGLPLISYIEALDAIAKKHGFHVLNMHTALPIDLNKPEDNALYSPDGLHFNDAGHRAIADVLEKFLRDL